MSACSTHFKLQAGTVQLSDQHSQLGGSYAGRPNRNTGLPDDTMTPITHTRQPSNILRVKPAQSLRNSNTLVGDPRCRLVLIDKVNNSVMIPEQIVGAITHPREALFGRRRVTHDGRLAGVREKKHLSGRSCTENRRPKISTPLRWRKIGISARCYTDRIFYLTATLTVTFQVLRNKICFQSVVRRRSVFTCASSSNVIDYAVHHDSAKSEGDHVLQNYENRVIKHPTRSTADVCHEKNHLTFMREPGGSFAYTQHVSRPYVQVSCRVLESISIPTYCCSTIAIILRLLKIPQSIRLVPPPCADDGNT